MPVIVEKQQARAIDIAERIDVRGIEPWLLRDLPVTVAVGAAAGCAMIFRSGAVVLFGVEPLAQESFLRDLAPRLLGAYSTQETAFCGVLESVAEMVILDFPIILGVAGGRRRR